jgi:high-affinity nickel-transport protein
VDPLPSAVVAGFILGLQHATDPDHLVAVATIVSRQRRFAAGATVGVLWGLGHMLTLSAAAAVIVAIGRPFTPAVTTGLELAVAAMLVVLGVGRLRTAGRGLDAVAPEHLTADHDHHATEAVHSHAHVHGTDVHQHPHLHPSRKLMAALGQGGVALATRAVLVGAVHGLAGSAAISLLILATLRTAGDAVAYLGAFGLGTLAGMTLLTAVMAYPVALALRWRRARQVLAVGTGVASIVLGVIYAASVL